MEYNGGNLSLYIYIFLPLAGGVMSVILGRIVGFNIQSNVYLWFRPFAVLFASMVISILFKNILDVLKKPKVKKI